MRKIEVCCNSVDDVFAARAAGAIRVELCTAIESGGLTPSAGLIAEAVKESHDIAVNVLIRPRGGDFVYSEHELTVMEADIDMARRAGAQGVVIGVLTARGEIDIHAMKRLLDRCGGLDVTFHRAFDVCSDPFASLEQIIDLGIPRLLTSGCRPSAMQGVNVIKRLIDQAARRISIMPGAGITPSNISEIEAITGAEEFHSTCTDKSIAAPHDTPLFGAASRTVSASIVRALVNI